FRARCSCVALGPPRLCFSKLKLTPAQRYITFLCGVRPAALKNSLTNWNRCSRCEEAWTLWRCAMSDNIILLNDMKGDAGRNRAQQPTPTNSRLQWLAALVSVILDAENLKSSSSTAKRPPAT